MIDLPNYVKIREAHDLYRDHVPKTRWQIGRTHPIVDTKVEHDNLLKQQGSLYNLALEAYSKFSMWMPFRYGTISDRHKIILEHPENEGPLPQTLALPEHDIQAKHLRAACLFAFHRYLDGRDGNKMTPEEASEGVGPGSHQITYILDKLYELRSIQGQCAQERQEIEMLKKQQVGSDETGRALGFPEGTSGMTKQDRRRFIQAELDRKNRKESKLTARIQRFTTPMRLLAAAVDSSSFRFIKSAKRKEKIRYARRIRYFHAPLLYGLGKVSTAEELDDLALSFLNAKRYHAINHSLGPLHPVIHPLVQDLGGHVHRMGVAGLIGKANVLGRVKSASSTERKLYEKADSVKGTQSGFERYREKPFNLHDAVGVEVTHEGSDTQDVIELADALKIHLIGKNVAGYEIIGFEAPSGEKYYKDYSAGKPDSGYRAIHLKALVQKTSNELPPLKAIEFHCTNDKWREENEFGRASHVVYKGQDNPQTVTEYVPEEELAKNLTVRVKIGRDKKTHKLDLLEGDHAHMILDALVSREIVSIPEALQGRTVLYEEYAPTEEQVRKGLRIPNPVSLRQIIDPTRTYHLIDLKNEGHLGSPEPLSFYDLNRLEAQVDERLWIQAIQEAKAKVTQAAKDKKRQEAESREDVKRRIASTDSTNRSIVMQRGLTSPERSGTDAETGSRFPRERFESRVEPPEKPTNTRHGKGRKKRT